MVRLVWVGGGLLVVSVGCSALSLGAAQGQALIGRPLDISIPLTLGDGESVTDACASAQVFFADDAVSAAGVKTTVVGGAQASSVTFRVQTSVPVTEAFARIELQVGCGQRVARSYVLLADLAPSAPPAAPLTSTAKTPPTALAAPAARVDDAVTGPALSVPKARPVKPTVARATPRKPSNPPVGSSVVPTKISVPASAPQGAKLTLDSLELVAAVGQMQPSLRLSVDAPLESVDNADLAQRRQAARLLWKALNDSPDQLAAGAIKAQADDAEINRIKSELAEAQRQAQVAQAQLLEEQDSRYTNPLFLALVAALVAALVGLVVVIRRQRLGASFSESPPWWKSQVPQVPPAPAAFPADAKRGVFDHFKTLLEPLQKIGALTLGRRRSEERSSRQFDESSLSASAAPQAVAPSFRVTRVPVEFAKSSMFEMGRSVATEELFDLQQQVEFFISLDQADQAIEVLQAHLNDSSDPSPLAYLDLLKLHHDLGQRKEYSLLQLKFNKLFNGHAPDFDRYSTSDRGLEQYGTAMSQIQALWPEPAVLQLIERSIFRTTLGEQTDVFDLEAYRELLLLYGIARELIEEGSQGIEPPLQMAAQGVVLAQKSPFGSTVSDLPHAHLTLGCGNDTAFGDESAGSDFGVTNPDGVAAANPNEVGMPSVAGWALDLDLSVAADEKRSVSDSPNPAMATHSVVEEVQNQSDLPAVSVPKHGVALDLDFSDLGDTETFTIKKSGQAA